MDKNILILGASSEVGIKYIRSYHNRYSHIWAHYNQSSEELLFLKETLKEKIHLLQADLLSYDATKNLITDIKSSLVLPDYVLHLPSGKYQNCKFHKISWDRYQKSLDIQLRSIVMVLEAFLPAMAKKSYGKIVIMLSSCTVNQAPKYISEYLTSKYALLGLMKAISSEYAPKGICVNGISPGMMETKLLSSVPELIVMQNAAASPSRRNTTVEDVLPSIDFLLSSESDFITGQNIVISGGAY